VGVTEVVGADGGRWTIGRRFNWPDFELFGPDEEDDVWAGNLMFVVGVAIFIIGPFVVFLGRLVTAVLRVPFGRSRWER
jgi:hypothetical protein